MMNRRRFLTISAGLMGLAGPALAQGLHVERGMAMGAAVTLRLAHPDGAALAQRAMAEIARLEGIFSLYRADSALVQLNAAGRLDAPPPELLECLTLAGAVHRASGGVFDPTVQALWLAYAGSGDQHLAMGQTGWDKVHLDAEAITLDQGAQITLNGIAQGYVADKVADLLAKAGLSEALIDTGEMRALPGRGFDVTLPDDRQLALRGRALATSAPLGMTFRGDGRTSHILDPRTGAPVAARWHHVTISAPKAALADAISTASCLTKIKAEMERLCEQFPGTRVESARAL
jgi:thiamine biosynthesis lipoprotein